MSAIEETACSCDTCKSMCKIQPCIGTPEDILKLIQAGHAKKLAQSSWLIGVLSGTTDNPVDMIQLLALEDGSCTFLDEKGLCTLHELNLKPTEGKLSHHDDHLTFSGNFEDTINYKVAMTWVDENGVNDPLVQLVNAARNQIS